MDKLKTKRAAAASLAVLLVGVPVGILALAISKAVKACKRPANEEAENFLAESEGNNSRRNGKPRERTAHHRLRGVERGMGTGEMK